MITPSALRAMPMPELTGPLRGAFTPACAQPGPCAPLVTAIVAACDDARLARDAWPRTLARVRLALVAYATCARAHRLPPPDVLQAVTLALRESLLPLGIQRELREALADAYYAAGRHARAFGE